MPDAAELDALWEDHRKFQSVWEAALNETHDLVSALCEAADQGEPLHELAARFHEAVKASDVAKEAFRKSCEKIREAKGA